MMQSSEGNVSLPPSLISLAEKMEKLIEEVPTEYVEEMKFLVESCFAKRLHPEQSSSEESDPEVKAPGQKRQRKEESGIEKLRFLQHFLRTKVPVTAVLPTENILNIHDGEFKSSNTVSVDGFLYEEEDIDELCDAGKLSRNYCLECGSHRTQPLNFISHSLSIPELQFIFEQALPKIVGGRELRGASVLDVGSRLGGVVLAASLLGKCKAAVGVETNAELCAVQQAAVAAGGLAARVRVVCDDVSKRGEEVAQADVVVLHNPFQFFQTPQLSRDLWSFLRHKLRACEAGWGASEWAEEVAVEYPAAAGDDDEYAGDDGRLFSNVRFYRVPPAPAPSAK